MASDIKFYIQLIVSATSGSGAGEQMHWAETLEEGDREFIIQTLEDDYDLYVPDSLREEMDEFETNYKSEPVSHILKSYLDTSSKLRLMAAPKEDADQQEGDDAATLCD